MAGSTEKQNYQGGGHNFAFEKTHKNDTKVFKCLTIKLKKLWPQNYIAVKFPKDTRDIDSSENIVKPQNTFLSKCKELYKPTSQGISSCG